jgi:hypothetical protein
LKERGAPRYVGRPIATYGSSDDPGVELAITKDSRQLDTLVPSLEERFTSKRIWNASSLCETGFLLDISFRSRTLPLTSVFRV